MIYSYTEPSPSKLFAASMIHHIEHHHQLPLHKTPAMMMQISTLLLVTTGTATGFVVPQQHNARSSSALDATVGIYFGTSTGSTEEVADLIKDEFGDDADGPFDVEALDGSVKSNFEKYGVL